MDEKFMDRSQAWINGEISIEEYSGKSLEEWLRPKCNFGVHRMGCLEDCEAPAVITFQYPAPSNRCWSFCPQHQPQLTKHSEPAEPMTPKPNG